MTCDRCGRANREGARFCDACGSPLAAPSAAESDGTRKVVTIVFADLAGSTPLQERLDPESARQLMDRYYAAMRAAVDDHHGTVVKLLGDGVMAVFGVPHVGEDDAVRAVRAAHAMQVRFGAVSAGRPGLGEDFGLRVGINTGEVVVSAADDDVVGDPVNVAARLQEHAGLGEVLLGEPTRRLVDGLVTLEPAGDLQLKGRAEPVAAHRLVSLDPPVTRAATRLVGRAPELERLEAALDRAVVGGARLTMVLGSPGLGKTRLLDELDRRVRDRATVLTGRCDPGGLATFAPIAEALRAATGVGDAVPADVVRQGIAALVPDDEPERDRIVDRAGAVLGIGAPASPDETFWAVRRVLAGLARARPVVLVLDDLHWAEPLLLDLVEHVVEWSPDVPLLLVGAARLELRELRPSLASPGGVADVVVLDALDAGAATQLAADVLGAEELPAAVAGRVLAASEGNPLFVRELVRMLVEDGVLHRDGDRWQAAAELAAVEIPPTIHALLASRIERLRPEQRAVIERAAVIGRQFTRAAVDHLVTPELARDLDDHLDALRSSELVEADDTWYLGEPVLRFHHALIRDAAYRRLLKGTRAELHEAYADWLGDRLDAGALDRDDTLGWHLEQAHASLVELEQDDEHVRALGRRAADHLARAGHQALERDDLTVAAGLLGRALDRLDDDDPARADLQLERCEALLAAGEVVVARHAVDALATSATGDPRLVAWHTAFVAQLTILTEPERLPEVVESIAPVAGAMHAAGDVSGEAKAHYVHALALSRLGRVGAAESALDRALAAARSAGDRRLANAVLSGAPLAALWGPSPVTRASGRCLDVVRVLRITAGAPAVEAVALRCQAVLEALRGRVDAARRMIASARRTLEDLGLTHRLLETEVFAGIVELYDDDPHAAEARLRPAFEQLRTRGLGGEAAQAAALLGRALLQQGRDAEADALGRAAEALAGADLKAAIAWRGVQAEAAARRGDAAAALALARAAVDLAAGTDALLDHADARLALAAVLRAVGDDAAATAEARRAADLYEAKGATVLAARAAAGTVPVARPAPTRPAPSARGARVDARPPVENAASATMRRSGVALSAKDWEGYVDCFAPTCRITDRQSYTHVDLDVDEFLESFRTVMDFEEVRATNEILEARGEDFALSRQYLWGASSDGAVSDFEILSVARTDENGRATRIVWLKPDDLDAARAELERMAAEDAAAPHSLVARALRAWARRDWEGFTALLAPDFRQVDRRAFGGGEVTRDAFLENFRTMFDDDWTMHRELLASRDDRVALIRVHFAGNSGASGTSEVDALIVDELDEDGLARVEVVFDPDDLDGARAMFDRMAAELGAVAPEPFENAAVRTMNAFVRAWQARDWGAVLATFTQFPLWIERRSLARLEIDSVDAFETLHAIFDTTDSTWDPAVLATRGERLALFEQTVRVTDRASGTSEVPFLVVLEVDGDGRTTAVVAFDAEDLDGSFDELDERFAAGEASSAARVVRRRVAIRHAFVERDWQTIADAFRPDAVLEDHRPLGWGRITVDQYIDSLRDLAELVPDARLDLTHVLTTDRDRSLYVTTEFADGDDGVFEVPMVIVSPFDVDGRISRADAYALDQIDEAWARYHALAGMQQIENAATRAFDDIWRRWHAGDWDEVVALFHPRARQQDRRSVVSLDVEGPAFFENLRTLYDAPLDVQSEVVATRGDRLVLVRMSFVGADGATPFRVDHLSVNELDEAGLLTLSILFDLDDLDAAYDEMDARFIAAGPDSLAGAMRGNKQFLDAYADRDWATAAELIAPDAEFEDHRPMGWGVLDRDGYLATLRTLPEVAPDAVLRTRHIIDFRDRSFLSIWEVSGDSGFEIQFALVTATDEVGRTTRMDFFGLDQLDEARRCYDEGAREVRFENEAARAVRRSHAAWSARDWDAYADHYSSSCRFVDRQAVARTELGRDDFLASMRAPFGFEERQVTLDVIATRGERLVLTRETFRGSTGLVGESETSQLELTAIDDDGRFELVMWFDSEDLDAAYDELDARYTAGEGAPFADLIATSIAFRRGLTARDWAAVAGLVASSAIVEDHRPVGWGIQSVDEYVASTRTLLELVPDVRIDIRYVLELDGDRTVFVSVASGVGDSGTFEIPLVVAALTDEGGRIARIDVYDLDQLDDARERHTVVESLGSTPSISNAVTRQRARFVRAWRAHDWNAVAATFADDHQMRDGRSLVRLDYVAGSELTDLHTIFDAQAIAETFELIATRGERLALFRSSITVSRRTDSTRPGVDEAIGLAEIGRLVLHEVDDQERFVLTDVFDPDSVDAAYEELDERFAAGEAAPFADRWAMIREFAGSYGRVDVDAHARGVAEDYIVVDHRPLGWGRLDKGGYLEQLRVINELSPDAVSRLDHVPGLCERGSFVVTTTVGTPVSGKYEIPVASVAEYDLNGRLARTDYYSPDQVDDAWTRYRSLAADHSFENDASRVAARVFDMCRHGDDPADLFADGFRLVDRRQFGGTDLTAVDFVDGVRAILTEGRWTTAREVVATRGERLALVRMRWSGEVDLSGESELQYLALNDLGQGARLRETVLFETGDLDAAYDELDARFVAGEGAGVAAAMEGTRQFMAAYDARDWPSVRDLLSPFSTFHDHRLMGFGKFDRDRYLEWVAAIPELSTDAKIRTRHVLVADAWRGLGVLCAEGGGDERFEIPFVLATARDDAGRTSSMDFFGLDQLDEAWARYHSLAEAPASSAAVAPNAASRAFDRALAAFRAQRAEGYRELCAPGFVFEDRANHIRLDIDAWVKDAEFVGRGIPDIAVDCELLATAGDRLAAVRLRWSGTVVTGGPFATEMLQVLAVDEHDLLTAVLKYEPEDRVEAFGEMLRRFAEEDAVAHPGATALLRDLSHAVLTNDWDAWQAMLADDFSLEDRRSAGIGTITGPDFVAAQRVMAELSPDSTTTPTEVLSIADHGWLVRVRIVGTLADGGPFENDHLDLFTIAAGEITHVELFDPDDAAAALARLEELAPIAWAPAENAAVRTERRRATVFESRDWGAWEELFAESMVFDDRRALLRTVSDWTQFRASAQFIADEGGRFAFEVLGTAGDRLVLERVHWTMIDGHSAQPVDVGLLAVNEVDADGRITAVVYFDPDDRATAVAELERRFVAGEAAGCAAGQAPITDFDAAFAARDWAALRDTLGDDFVSTDHRPGWMGSSDREEYLASMRAFAELSPDVTSENVEILAWGDHGRVARTRVYGTQRDGGPFENAFAWMLVTGAGHIRQIEVWGVDEVDAALGAFERARPGS